MKEYGKWVPTSAEVWAVIRARHHEDLEVVGSFSAPDGNYCVDPGVGVMATLYGLKGANSPLIGAETRWDIDQEKPYERINERHEYWLCYPKQED